MPAQDKTRWELLPGIDHVRAQYYPMAHSFDMKAAMDRADSLKAPKPSARKLVVGVDRPPRSTTSGSSAGADTLEIRGTAPAGKDNLRPETAASGISTYTVRNGTGLDMPSFMGQKEQESSTLMPLYAAKYPHYPAEHVSRDVTYIRETSEKFARTHGPMDKKDLVRLRKKMTAAEMASARVPIHRRLLLDFERNEHSYKTLSSESLVNPFKTFEFNVFEEAASSYRKPQGEISSYLNKAILGHVNLKATGHV